MSQTPREAGCRWPAEWEEHAATWLSWPHNPDTWPGALTEAERAFVAMGRALHGREALCINVQDEATVQRVQGLLREAGVGEGVSLHVHPTDDAWVRDHGPIFLQAPDGRPTLVDFGFNAWGGKYPPWDRDDAIPGRIARLRGARCFRAGFVLEGGSVDGDGEGTILTTECCLLQPNRRLPGEPPRTREGMERHLRDYLCAERVLWLGEGIEGDDTDGHVDDVARFVAPAVVVAAEERDASDPNHRPLAENLRRLAGMRDAKGRRLTVVPLPMPPRRRGPGGTCPASYVNFYLANGVILVPVFGAPSDDVALGRLADLLPGREVAPIPARTLVLGLGAVHCLTQQEPALGPREGPGRQGQG